MVNWKSYIAGLGLSALSFFGCMPGGGEPIKADYPPLTPEIQESLEGRMLNIIENHLEINDSTSFSINYETPQQVDFHDTTQEFINYLIEFTQKDFEQEGVELKGLDGLKIRFEDPKTVSRLCQTHNSRACYMPNKLILMPNNLELVPFLNTFFHELGHYFYDGNKEFPSISFETYSNIKIMEFSEKLGSLVSGNTFRHLDDDRDLNQYSSYERMYAEGNLLSIINLIDFNGNVEKAFYHILHTREPLLQAALHKGMARYEGLNPREMSSKLWEELLASKGFKNELVNNWHLMGQPLNEYMDYLKISNKENLNFYTQKSKEFQDEMIRLWSDFESNPDYDNPYFKSRAVVMLTNYLNTKYDQIMENPTPENLRKGFDLAKKVILLNENYPCELEDPFECYIGIRGIRRAHTLAYLNAINNAFKLGDKDIMLEAVDIGGDFMFRFFPEINPLFNDFSALKDAKIKEANNIVPVIGYTIGGFLKFVIDNEYFGNVFLNAAVTIPCLENGELVSEKECLDLQDASRELLNITP